SAASTVTFRLCLISGAPPLRHPRFAKAFLEPGRDGGGELDHRALASDGGATCHRECRRGGAPEIRHKRNVTVLAADCLYVLDIVTRLAAQAVRVLAPQNENEDREERSEDRREETLYRRKRGCSKRQRIGRVREAPLQPAEAETQ